jgi:hypothetical protein
MASPQSFELLQQVDQLIALDLLVSADALCILALSRVDGDPRSRSNRLPLTEKRADIATSMREFSRAVSLYQQVLELLPRGQQAESDSVRHKLAKVPTHPTQIQHIAIRAHKLLFPRYTSP